MFSIFNCFLKIFRVLHCCRSPFKNQLIIVICIEKNWKSLQKNFTQNDRMSSYAHMISPCSTKNVIFCIFFSCETFQNYPHQKPPEVLTQIL